MWLNRGVGASQSISFRSNTIKHTWGYRDVPAINDESFITNLSNYRQGLEFQFAAIRFPDQQPNILCTIGTRQ
jgi:hypothetical protein